MSKVSFTNEQKAEMVSLLQKYFDDELDRELGQFEAEFLLDFFAKNIGAHYYNRGLHDARKIFENRVQAIDEDLYAIEQPV